MSYGEITPGRDLLRSTTRRLSLCSDLFSFFRPVSLRGPFIAYVESIPLKLDNPNDYDKESVCL